ncbi:MAG TPA: 1-acyl-sn-glycerol-3-phosphate acyltransferase [Microbacterium sp.]|nr:1-acyl-sn-glycerol-3-phosphate acyltransferase [Microbacterium sp.]
MSATRPRSTETTRPSLFWPLAAIVVPVTKYLARTRIRGAEKIPTTGAFVLAPNHYSEFDPLIVAVAVWDIGRAPRFLVKESLLRVPVVGWALRAVGMIPVSRGSISPSSRSTLSEAERLATSGSGVIVYPEGTLTRDPGLWPMRGKTGAVRLALESGAPLIPVAHWGVQEIMPRYGGRLRFWPPRKPVEVMIGDPIDLSDFAGRERQSAALVEATERLMNAIAALLEDLRDATAPPVRWNPAVHAQKETGRFES